jgi:hypothetical protein
MCPSCDNRSGSVQTCGVAPSTNGVGTGIAPFDVAPHDRVDAWHLAVRVAAAVSGVGAALAVALVQLAGLPATPVVGLLGLGGLVVGLQLPAAWPRLDADHHR